MGRHSIKRDPLVSVTLKDDGALWGVLEFRSMEWTVLRGARVRAGDCGIDLVDWLTEFACVPEEDIVSVCEISDIARRHDILDWPLSSKTAPSAEWQEAQHQKVLAQWQIMRARGAALEFPPEQPDKTRVHPRHNQIVSGHTLTPYEKTINELLNGDG